MCKNAEDNSQKSPRGSQATFLQELSSPRTHLHQLWLPVHWLMSLSSAVSIVKSARPPDKPPVSSRELSGSARVL